MKSRTFTLMFLFLFIANFSLFGFVGLDDEKVREKNLKEAAELLNLDEPLKGNIASVSYSYGCQWGTIDIIFDEKGRILSYTDYGDGGGAWVDYFYDQLGRKDHADISCYSEGERTKYEVEQYYYNTENLLVMKEVYLTGEAEEGDENKKIYNPRILTSYTRYIYDDKGNLTGERQENVKDNSWSKIIYSYGSNGKLVKKEILNSSDEKEIYVYDSRGNIISERKYKDYELRYSIDVNFVYDSRGNLLSKESYSDSRLLSSVKYKYDHRGKKISCESYDRNETGITVILYSYDAQGRLCKERHDTGTVVYEIEYKYDDVANLKSYEVVEDDNREFDPNIDCNNCGWYEYTYR